MGRLLGAAHLASLESGVPAYTHAAERDYAHAKIKEFSLEEIGRATATRG